LSLPVLVLASGSPRRIELLRGLGLDFVARPPQVDESVLAGEDPAAYVRRLARAKAEAEAAPGELVLAADTTVVVDGEILGKPVDRADARRMLGALAGREHVVFTAVALADLAAARTAEVLESARVRMAPMSAAEIAWYAQTGEPDDKAGAYAVQGLGALFVERIEGCHGTVVGLPLPAVYRVFTELGYDLRRFSPRT
jgi:septum formation protein